MSVTGREDLTWISPQNFVLLSVVSSCNIHFVPFTGIYFLWQEQNVSYRKGRSDADFPQNFLHMLVLLFLLETFCSCHMNFLPVTGTQCLLQEKMIGHRFPPNAFYICQTFCSCHRNFLPVTGISFLSQELLLLILWYFLVISKMRHLALPLGVAGRTEWPLLTAFFYLFLSPGLLFFLKGFS